MSGPPRGQGSRLSTPRAGGHAASSPGSVFSARLQRGRRGPPTRSRGCLSRGLGGRGPVSSPGNPGGQGEPPASWRGFPLPLGRRGAACRASIKSLSPQGSCLRGRAPRARGLGLRTRTLSEGRRLCCLWAIAAGQQPPAQSPELPRAATPRWERTPQTGRSLAPAPRARRSLLLPFISGNV